MNSTTVLKRGPTGNFYQEKTQPFECEQSEGNKMKTIIASLGIEINCTWCRRVQTQYDK